MFPQTTATAEIQVFWNEAARKSMIHLGISLITCPKCIQILQTTNLQICEHGLDFCLPMQCKLYQVQVHHNPFHRVHCPTTALSARQKMWSRERSASRPRNWSCFARQLLAAIWPAIFVPNSILHHIYLLFSLLWSSYHSKSPYQLCLELLTNRTAPCEHVLGALKTPPHTMTTLKTCPNRQSDIGRSMLMTSSPRTGQNYYKLMNMINID